MFESCVEIVVTLQQIVRGPPLREQQAEHLLVDRRRPLALGRGLRAAPSSSLVASSKSVPYHAHSPSPRPMTSPKPARAESGVELM